MLSAIALAAALQAAPVIRIQCGLETASAIVVNDREVITASHVLSQATDACRVGQSELRTVKDQPTRDTAALRTVGRRFPAMARLSCAPLSAGETYTLVGFPNSGSGRTEVQATATGRMHFVRNADGSVRFEGLTSLSTPVEIGFSGGAVVNANGEVQAVISSVAVREGLTLVQPLATTFACQG